MGVDLHFNPPQREKREDIIWEARLGDRDSSHSLGFAYTEKEARRIADKYARLENEKYATYTEDRYWEGNEEGEWSFYSKNRDGDMVEREWIDIVWHPVGKLLFGDNDEL